MPESPFARVSSSPGSRVKVLFLPARNFSSIKLHSSRLYAKEFCAVFVYYAAQFFRGNSPYLCYKVVGVPYEQGGIHLATEWTRGQIRCVCFQKKPVFRYKAQELFHLGHLALFCVGCSSAKGNMPAHVQESPCLFYSVRKTVDNAAVIA